MATKKWLALWPCREAHRGVGWGGTEDIFGKGFATGTLIPLPYTRQCSAAFCDPILD